MNRDKLILKIKALIAKTEDAGCTEAESMLAAAKAGELMKEYEVERSELDIQEDKYGKLKKTFRKSADTRRLDPVAWLSMMSVARFTDTRTWCYKRSGEVVFFGAYADTQIASFLLEMICNIARKEVAAYLASDDRPRGVHGNTLKASWIRGYAGRVSRRLDEMKKEQDADRQQIEQKAGTALMVIKDQLVEQKFQSLGLTFTTSSDDYYRYSNGSHDAHMKGKAAGDRVNLSSGITDKSSPSGLLS